ncbi:SPFH domain-containing protein [Paludibacterium purpuratum]|uniref:SPFH domain-containing protein n=1 Tax=Paludibacterium purpuratum TaxID=1144873 RepID=UPI001AAD6B94|nr:SPFH domain-containing protein [Paludibacterium purpuratum]
MAILLWASVVVVGGNEIALIERRWFGKKMPQGRVVALGNEVGIQARTLGPGLHFLIPFIYKATKSFFTEILDNEIGMIESVDGQSIPAGRIFASVAADHNSFQDGEAFIRNGGQKGPQIEVLAPGKYRINPYLFKITKGTVTEIKDFEIGMVESVDGEAIPEGKIFAQAVSGHSSFQNGDAFIKNGGQKGPQIEIIPPGSYRINPYLFKVTKSSATQIKEGEIGLVESSDGAAIPAGRIFAQVVGGHNSFQDGEAFILNGGQKGPQIEILPPGMYRIHPNLFKITSAKAVVIGKGEVGTVTAQDGAPIQMGRLLAQSVAGHSNYENGDAFLKNGGQKGPQIDVLLPGTYRINLNLFVVQVAPAVVIEANKVGLVTALDGVPLPEREYVACPITGHNDYQDGSAFLTRQGQRGPQLDVLRPGTYYINPSMFSVAQDDVAVIERGQVGVIVSNVGEDPTDEMKHRIGSSQVDALAEEGKERYVVPKGFRGIQEEVAGPGRYYLNRRAFMAYIIDTTNITIDWDDQEGTRFDQLMVISKDGFPIQVSVKVVIRVRPDQAPYMVAKVGSIDNLIQHVIHPMIDSSFRNQASTASAMNFLQSRSEEQLKAENRARTDLERYHVECVSVLICQIRLPEDLMQTQTKRIIAEQQQEMYKMEQRSQAERTEMEKMRATADQQPTLVASEIAVQVAAQKKTEMITLAEGAAEAKALEGTGEGKRLTAIGDGEASKIAAIGEATAQAYNKQQQAIGEEAIKQIKIVELIASAIEAGHIKIVPDVLVTGGGHAADGLMGMLTKLLPDVDLSALTKSALPLSLGSAADRTKP